MTLILASGQVFDIPQSPGEAPWNTSTTPCATPTPDGSGATIHPSVVDMGRKWRGYRWWMANTPYPNKDDSTENPCVYGSNDRMTWTVPAGVTNPIDPFPGGPWFHSDTEIVFDRVTSRMVVLYRRSELGGEKYLHSQSSSDGVTWTDHGSILTLTGTGGIISPAVCEDAGQWRLWMWGYPTSGLVVRYADSPLGPWTNETTCTLNGGVFSGWHGGMLRHGGKWITAYSTSAGSGIVKVAASLDGTTWTGGDTVFTGSEGGWATTPYRPTLSAAPERGYVDCWYGAYGASVAGGCATGYVRLPDSLWPAP